MNDIVCVPQFLIHILNFFLSPILQSTIVNMGMFYVTKPLFDLQIRSSKFANFLSKKFRIFAFSHFRIFSFSHFLISHFRIFAFSHFRIFSFSHFRIFAFSHFRIFAFSHLRSFRISNFTQISQRYRFYLPKQVEVWCAVGRRI
jgi:hypothetical protein